MQGKGLWEPCLSSPAIGLESFLEISNRDLLPAHYWIGKRLLEIMAKSVEGRGLLADKDLNIVTEKHLKKGSRE